MLKNRLLQLFKDNNGKGRKIKSEVAGTEATLYLYDAIGDWYGISAKDFNKELVGLKGSAETVHLRVNSPGGDVFEARAIATAIRQCGMNVIAHIDGVCASAATYVALSCSSVEMAEGAFFMIHRAWTMQMGNCDDMHEMGALLEKIDSSIATDYVRKTGKTTEDVCLLMAEETWFTATEALDHGFIDSIFTGEEVENSWNLDAYKKVPAAYKEKKETGLENVFANNDPLLYDRERFEKRLSLFEASI